MNQTTARHAHTFAILIASLFLAPSAGFAQTSLQIPLQFDFLNPGAKSKALGGAFVGLADDSTATYANPAGLILITRPEVFIEGRTTHLETPFLDRGRLSGTIFNERNDVVQGPVFGTSVGNDTGIAFAAGVYTRPSGRWSVAAFRHELVRIDQRFQSNGVFQQDPTEFTSRRDDPQEGIRTVDITGYGVTSSYRVGPQVAVGVGVTVYSFSLGSQFRRFGTIGALGDPNLNEERGRSTQDGDDTAVAPTIGALFGLSGRVRVGVMYRHGPSFTFETTNGSDPPREGHFRVPHTLAVGASFRPVPVLTLAAEVTRVQYSRLRRDFVTEQSRVVAREADFTIDSGTEIHVGAQYLATISHGAPKLRGGVWYDPDHTVQFAATRPATTPVDRLFNERLATALSSGRNLLHYTGGIGFSLNPRLELNGGFDLTSRSRTASVSFVIRTT